MLKDSRLVNTLKNITAVSFTLPPECRLLDTASADISSHTIQLMVNL